MGFEIKNGVLKKYTEEPGVTEVVIPDGVTRIGDWAFSSCSSLTAVTIPDSVTSIGMHAFSGCSSLSTVTIPDSMMSIGIFAFNGCSSLTSVTIPDSLTSIGYGAFSGCKGLADDKEFVIIKNVLYDYFGNDREITIPDSLTTIGYSAFSMCESLTSVTIPDSVTSIGDSAFWGCENLTTVSIGNGVTSIGDTTFEDCKSLTTIVIGKCLSSLNNIPVHNLTEIKIDSESSFFYSEDNIVYSKDRKKLIRCAGKKEGVAIIPDSVTSIGNKAFYKCSSLTSVTIGNSVTSIGGCAFNKCTKLKSVTIPDGVTSIGGWAFEECTKLKSVTIPDGVTSIECGTFEGCSDLISVTIPNSVTTIENDAFRYCYKLTTATIGNSVTSIGNSAFYGCLGETDDNGFRILGNILLSYTGKQKSITIPENVIYIYQNSFEGCKELTDVTFSKNVRYIGMKAFFECDNLSDVFFLGKLPEKTCSFPTAKIHVPESVVKSDEKIDPKFVRVAETVDNEGLAYLLVYQTAKVWRNPLCYEAAERNVQELFELQIDILKSIEKPAAATVSAVLDYAVRFIDKLKSSSVKELYELFKEKKCKKQLKQMDEDTNIQEKMNSGEDVFETEKSFYESFMEEHNIKALTIAGDIKEFGISIDDVPDLTDKDGMRIPKAIAAWLLIVHGTTFDKFYYSLEGGYQKTGICHEAEEIVSRIAPDALQKFILAFFGYLGSAGVSKKMFLAYPMCRYADEKTMAYLTSQAPKWSSRVSGNDAPPLLSFRNACLYSNTRSAMLFAERYHEIDKYAELRGMDEDTFRDMYLSDIGLDTQGGKEYDLGNQTVTARLQKDLSFLFELPNGKTAKSLPKKGADTDKYEAAKKDFDEMKKAAKKILKSRGNVLFEDFLSGKTRKAQAWKDAYISNPLLRNIAKIVVWAQGNNTFVLTDNGAIDCNGQTYTITDEEIKIAHPMEMDKADVTAWQKYFADNNLKQPFAQVWEPVRDPAQIKENRYEGCRLEVYQFSGKDKHGIHAYGVHAYSEDFGFELDGCELDYECDTWRLDEIKGVYYTLGKFSFKKFTRKVNHIITILDKMTVSDRVLKDDASVVEQMDSFTVAQIIEFISMAQEAGAVNVTAALLEYRNNNYPDYNVMDEFVLDW